jgi:hypothetical protein
MMEYHTFRLSPCAVRKNVKPSAYSEMQNVDKIIRRIKFRKWNAKIPTMEFLSG